jgi:phage gpG-like protein
MIETRVEFVNLPEVDRKLGRISGQVETLRPLWERFGKEFYAEGESLFNAAPWAPLSPAYEKAKRKKYGSKPLLRASDALFKSLTQQGAAGNVHRISDREAEFGSSDPKAVFHEFGTGRMPARPPLAEPDIDQYETIAGKYLEEIMRSAGFN